MGFVAVCDAVLVVLQGNDETITAIAARFCVNRGWIRKWVSPALRYQVDGTRDQGPNSVDPVDPSLEYRMVIILMGVSGAGKTTVGKLLANDLGWTFYEGDDFHPRSNVVKMAQGIALTDDDRWPWLDELHKLIDGLVASGQNAVVACSALREGYRQHLRRGDTEVVFVYLKGDYQLIRSRIAERHDHFMKADLLESQFRTLEEPEGVVTVDVSLEPAKIVDAVKKKLGFPH